MQHHASIAEALARLLDEQFSVGNVRFGLDPILGIIPGIGDALYIFVFLHRVDWEMQIPKKDLLEMFGNITIDFLIGVIPVIEDIGDVAFKANTRNIAILHRHLRKNVAGTEFA